MSAELKDKFAEAINSRDLKKVDDITTYLRCSKRMNYINIQQLALELTGISAADWDDFMYELDALDD
jgi:hypothetical protein